ncbi:hypothetical protein [Pseudorhodoplanes sp.]|uniref:hypothetical protein n=1 Tax=Pseudorhodoplanes sp. TaxID=1934341 RepID=UPI002B8A96AA|nr:hypothetical protein [Pseudorhodoplanes sp.]HWV42822.1 hypothetical protein [Pseudorhodoplanes sp.]
MSLPPRSFYSLTEVAVRWSVMPFDVIGWSTDGLLALSIAVPPVKTEPAETLSGLVDVEAPHLLPLFRRDGAPSPTVVVRRLKAGEGAFCWIVEPMEGIGITAADVLVRRAEVERFERQYGFFNGLHVPDVGGGPMERRRGGPGVPPRHDWDAFYAALTRRIHDHGVPATQAELVRDMLAWFEARDVEHAPDESTIRKKITSVWRELSRA